MNAQAVPHNLTWLHVAIGQAKWRCSRRDDPREWELTVAYWRVPPKGRKCEPESLAVVVRVDDGSTIAARRRFIRTSFQKARLFLQGQIMQASRDGRIDGNAFSQLLPPTETPPNVALQAQRGTEFDDLYWLIEPTVESDGKWILRDRETLNEVRFRLPTHPARVRMVATIKDAVRRIEALNARALAVREHTASGGVVTH